MNVISFINELSIYWDQFSEEFKRTISESLFQRRE